ncbi:MAG: PLP-dependent aminotransferase family protein [Actinomycetota bacterium]
MFTKQLQQLRDEAGDASEPWDQTRIAQAFGALIARGTIEAGDKLAPIRTVARELGVSTATVADAWSILRSHGLISTDRRRGTTVRADPGHGRSRYWRVPMAPGQLDLDLSTGTPDPALLPDLTPILAGIQGDLDVTSYLEPPIVPELGEELRRRWPYDPPALMVLDGANDGLDRVAQALLRLGDVAVVEDPTYPLLLDQLETLGVEIVGVPMDEDGPDLVALGAALARDPRALFLQTGAQNPTGIALSPARAAAIADLVADLGTTVIEDHSGLPGPRSEVTIGTRLPDRVVRIHSFSKTHGPDLRIAAMAGPTDLIDEVERRRQLGPGWTSRLIQRVLLEMLRRPEVDAQVATASAIYRDRRAALADALGDHGLTTAPGGGLNLWVPVAHEHIATVSLTANGIGVAPGEPFRVTDRTQHIRVTSARVAAEVEAVAATIAAAAAVPAG